MSSGAQHYHHAEELLAENARLKSALKEASAAMVSESVVEAIRYGLTHTMATAQVHATLALAAATVEAGGLDTWEVEETGASGDTEWGKAVRS